LDRYQKFFWIFLGALTVLRLLFIGQFELSPDEAYYWTWSRHLDWSYYDQGPMLALVIRFFTSLVHSSSEWSVRLGAVVLSAATAWVFFLLVRRMFASSRAAWYASLALQSTLLFSAGAVLMMHDTIMMFFWVGALYAFYRALLEDWRPGWAWGALALGLGGLAKYTMALFVPCLLLYLLVSPAQRRWWRRPQLYVAGLAALVCTAPVWYWNHMHGWASFSHIGDLSGAGRSWTVTGKYIFEFLGGQLAVMTPVLGAWALAAPVLAWLGWRNRRERAAAESERYLFLACFSGPVLVFFLLLSLHTRIYANWPAPAYPAALILLAGWLEAARSGSRPRLALRWARIALILGALLTLLIHLEVGWNILPLSGRAADSLNRVRGWRDVGAETGRRLAELKSPASPLVVAARRYQVAAIISFYAPGHPEVQLFPLHEPADNQYRFWDQRAVLAGRDVLYVCEDAWEADHLRPNFRTLEALAPRAEVPSVPGVHDMRFFRGRDYQPPGATAVGYAAAGPEAKP
jgi:4-amino-4-deoxy-L-arabinose transferase-like glycosyltransferase